MDQAEATKANIKETHDLIASDKVEGTKVYGKDDEEIGAIERIVVEKRSGRVAYAVMSFGGFFGIGHDHYPIPWEKLTYDEHLGGYRTDIQKEHLERAPRYESNETDEYNWSRDRGRQIYDYYGVPMYWM